MSELFLRSFGITPLRALMDMAVGCLIGALIAYVEQMIRTRRRERASNQQGEK